MKINGTSSNGPVVSMFVVNKCLSVEEGIARNEGLTATVSSELSMWMFKSPKTVRGVRMEKERGNPALVGLASERR